MEIRQLYYVLEVAKFNSFSKAANAQFITQPAISQQINALEEELQVKLFKRDTHSVALTKEGEKFCAYAKDVVESIDRLMAAFNQSTTKDKTVIKIGVFPFYKAAGLTPVINSFFAANHNVIGSIKVEENYQAYEKLETGELDFAILKASLEDIPKSGVKYEILQKDNYENQEIAAIPIEPKQEILTFLAYPRKRRLTGAYLAFKNHVIGAFKK
mgnify:CR=1 FL=1